MNDRMVVNAGPLIALARAEALDVVARLPFEFICPEEVAAELRAGVQAGYPIAHPGWLRTLALAEPLHPIALSTLDRGVRPLSFNLLWNKRFRTCAWMI